MAASPALAVPVGSAFTYQGRLADGANPANGPHDLRFVLYDAAVGGAQVGSIVTLDDVPVVEGLFAVPLDFGPDPFRGDARWLEIAVRPGASTGAYAVVGARQELRPAPNAMFSRSSAEVQWSGVTGKPPGFADNVDNDSGGTVTSVTTGAGLTGGPITASGSVSVATGGIVSGMIANGAVGASKIDPSQVQTRISGVCPLGSYLRGINPDGSVVCTGIPNPHTNSTAVLLSGGFAVEGHTSIAVPPDGRPVIAYQVESSASKSLFVTRCGNVTCSAGNVFRQLDSTAGQDVGSDTSIAIGSDGFPVVAYHNETAGTLKVAKCVNADCTGGTVVTTVDDHPTNTVGEYSSIAIGADGFPVISYYDRTAGGLKVAKCVNVNCTGLNTITTVHNPPNDVGRDTSIAVGSDGLPVISYRDATIASINVARCTNAACNSGASVFAAAPAGSAAGGRGDMALGADGFPVITYERTEGQSSEIRVLKCGNAACNAGNTNNPLYFASGLGGASSSVAIGADGLPIISHWGPALRVSKCGDASCGSGNILSVLDSPEQASVGLDSSIAVGPDSLPVVSHLDSFNGTLRVSKCGNVACN
jgi:hypothetical protein